MEWSFQYLLTQQGRVGAPSRKFLAWLRRQRVPDAIVEVFRQGTLQRYRIDPKEDYDPANPRLYSAQDIMDTNSPGGVPGPLRHGLLVIGSVANGDYVALDIRDQVGAVGYVCHEMIHRAVDARDEYVEVAASPQELARLLRTGQVPLDYFEAIRNL